MGRSLRLCFVNLSVYPLFNPQVRETFGGAEVQLYLLATALARDPAFEVHVITGDHGQEPVERHENVTVHRGISLRRESLARRLARLQTVRFVRLIHGVNGDLVILRAAGLHVGLVRLVTRLFGQRLVYMTAHQIDCDGGYERQSGWLAGRFYRIGVRGADLVVCQSHEQRAMLGEHHERDAIVMPTLYDSPEDATPTEARDSVLWVARCEDWKRPEVFIELARRCEGEKFVMIMPRSSSQPEYYSRIEELARAVPNLQHIEFVPFLGIDEYFRRAKVFVQTSRQEGFPNTFVQAARNGAAIVSLEVNPDGFLERHACGACAGGSFERLVEQVQELLGDARERERQGSNAWRYARAHHDIGPIVERYKMMFRGLVDGGGSRS